MKPTQSTSRPHTLLPISVLMILNLAKLAAYDIPEPVLENFSEFLFAATLFRGLTEGYASEMAAKRSAMEGATKNAGEMIQKLTLTYNRGRQASITNDLIDIITGAMAAG